MKLAGTIRTGGRSARVRESVLRAAAEELAIAGLDDFSIAEVSRRAGVHETSVYRRWGSRAALIADATKLTLEAGVCWGTSDSLRGDLLSFFRSTIEVMMSPQGVSRLVVNIKAKPGDEYYDFFATYWPQSLGLLDDLFKRAEARGDWPLGHPWRPFFDCLYGAVFVRLFLTKEGMPERELVELIDFLLARVE